MDYELPSTAAVNIYLPAPDTSSILLPHFILHTLYPCTPGSLLQQRNLFNVSLFCATAHILQMSGEILLTWHLTRCDGAAIKQKRTSATKAWTVRKRKKTVWQVEVWMSDGEIEGEKSENYNVKCMCVCVCSSWSSSKSSCSYCTYPIFPRYIFLKAILFKALSNTKTTRFSLTVSLSDIGNWKQNYPHL